MQSTRANSSIPTHTSTMRRSMVNTLRYSCFAVVIWLLTQQMSRIPKTYTIAETTAPTQHTATRVYNEYFGPRNSFPTCEELMQRPYSPFSDGSFLTRKSTQVVWNTRQDGSRELTLPSTCLLKRYTAHEAGQCLKNKHALFVGDSLTRYQFLSLAYFLEHKKWPPRFQASSPCIHVDEHGNETCSKREEPNICAEGDWMQLGGWPSYNQNLGGGTDGGVYRGRMESQSVRVDIPLQSLQYISSEEDGRTKLSLVGEAGWSGTESLRGWKLTGCAHDASCRYTTERYEHNLKRVKENDFDWNYTLITDAFGPNGTSFREQYLDINYAFYN